MVLLCMDLQVLWHSAMHITMKGAVPFGSIKCRASERNLCFSNVIITDLVTITASTVRMLASGVKVTNDVSSSMCFLLLTSQWCGKMIWFREASIDNLMLTTKLNKYVNKLYYVVTFS